MAKKSETRREQVDFYQGVLEKEFGNDPIDLDKQLRHLQFKREYGLISIYTIGIFTIIAVLITFWIIFNSNVFLNEPSQKAILAANSEEQLALIEHAQKLCAAAQESFLNQVSRIVAFFLTPLLSILTLLIGYVFGRKNADTHSRGTPPGDS